MLEPHERLAILRLIRSERRPAAESLRTAAMYAGQVVLSVGLLLAGYSYFHGSAAIWAVVSAVLVIQPAMEQSIAASVVRVVANSVGGVVGIIVARILGDGAIAILAGLMIVVFTCERLRLDLGLRTACVSLVIIMLRSPGAVLTSASQRLGAVVIGCILALVVQLLAEQFRKWLGWSSPLLAPPGGPGSAFIPRD